MVSLRRWAPLNLSHLIPLDTGNTAVSMGRHSTACYRTTTTKLTMVSWSLRYRHHFLMVLCLRWASTTLTWVPYLGLSGMQQAGWTQPDNVNCGFNPFAGPIAYHEPAHSPHAGASAQASDGAEHWATPWSSNSGHDSDHAIVIPDSPVQASMPMPDPLDMSSILSVPSDGTYEPRPSMSSVTQPTFTNAAPAELSDAEVVELLKSVVAPSMPSSMPSPSLLGISPADVATQDPLQTLPPSNVWPQGLNDWMDVDHTRM
ncbi:hypothetical protein C8T65DRAFT_256716 [Cerioporus squamosus]|nr:hypothetical protein C8T65DRAFT_256716 [Cerioporus squamosus]